MQKVGEICGRIIVTSEARRAPSRAARRAVTRASDRRWQMESTGFRKQALVWGVLACSLVLNIVLLATRSSGKAKPAAAASSAAVAAVGLPAAASATDVADGVDWKVVRTALKSSPAASFGAAIDEGGDRVSAVYSRLFMWDVDLRHDLSNGDDMAVAYYLDDNLMPEVGAAKLVAKKKAKTFKAYRWQAPGDKFVSFWSETGLELPLQLKSSPLRDYQQITSLLKDRPTHKGMDFKTPVGTEVVAPFAGTVVRSNWNFGANGNCIEVQYDDGVLAKFLHLNENKVKPGDKVAAGQIIALTGNTGHSTAPHLHYQLNQGDKVLDPIDYHGTNRRQLDDAAMAQFKPAMQKLDAMIADQTAGL
jgi:biotin carboxyl carrier protein